MKKALIALGLAGFLLALIIYIGATFSPFDNQKVTDLATSIGMTSGQDLTDNAGTLIDDGIIFSVLDMKVFVVLVILAGAFTVCFFGGAHMLIDKLFYKKFYEEPRVWRAIRRGILVYLVLLSLLMYRFIDALDIVNSLLVIGLAGVTEILMIKFVDKQTQSSDNKISL